MGTKTGIEWTDHTFNPWIGCTKVSAGCANCYAKTRDDRHMLGPVSHWGPGAPRHITSAANWREPIRWAKAARAAGRRDKVFCASQADIFEIEAPVAARQALWKLIGDTCDALDWQLLTKRPENILSVMCDDNLNLGFFELTRCWLGTSAENQEAANKRIPELLAIDAAVRFLSCEPLLGPVDLAIAVGVLPVGITGDIDWVIAGGESGPNARPMLPEWAESLRDQCEAASAAFFFKQWGEWAPGACAGSLPSRTERTATWWDGRWLYDSLTPRQSEELHRDDAPDVYLLGKKAAGAMLDGREWKEFPTVRP
jgi:protein gp37